MVYRIEWTNTEGIRCTSGDILPKDISKYDWIKNNPDFKEVRIYNII